MVIGRVGRVGHTGLAFFFNIDHASFLFNSFKRACFARGQDRGHEYSTWQGGLGDVHECGGEWADSEADGVFSVGAVDLTFGFDG